MEEEDLITLTLDNYQEWSQLAIKYLSQHNELPYARGLTYDINTFSFISSTLFLHVDMEVLDSHIDLKSTDPFVHWIHLWEIYGDPHIPPSPKDLLPPTTTTSSPDEITPPYAPIAPTYLVLATYAIDSVQ